LLIDLTPIHFEGQVDPTRVNRLWNWFQKLAERLKHVKEFSAKMMHDIGFFESPRRVPYLASANIETV
jgi:hypothetical protein